MFVGVRDAAKIRPVAEKWLIGQEPLAPIPSISDLESGEEDSDSSDSGAASASEYGGKGRTYARSGSETDMQRIVRKKGRLFALSPDDEGDSSEDNEDESIGSHMTRKTCCKILLTIVSYMI